MAKERLLDLKQYNAPLDELPPASAPPAWGAPEIDLDSLAVAPDMLAARRQEIEVDTPLRRTKLEIETKPCRSWCRTEP